MEIKNSLGEINCTIKTISGIPSLIWSGFAALPEIKKTCNEMLNMVKTTGSTSFISDNRTSDGYDNELIEWTSVNFLPQMKALGIAKHAIIFPKDVFAAISTEEFKANLTPFFEAEVFTDMDEAVNWCKS